MDVSGCSPVQPSTSTDSITTFVDVCESSPVQVSTPAVAVRSLKSSRKRRIIKKLNELTPRCKMIYKEYKKSRKQLNFHVRAKRALKFTKEKSLEELTKDMNPYAKKLIKMQINLWTRKAKGRRFTDDEKLIALSIMKQSPKCYKFLHKIFIMPSKATLNKMVSKFNIESGINQQIFTLMNKHVEDWPQNKKFCLIIFDEIPLETGLSYNRRKDEICGFVELTERTNAFADHALVFMLRGAVYKWQQPIAYYYCEGATSGPQLKNTLKDIILAVINIGLTPVALVCDQGTAFQSALHKLNQDSKRDNEDVEDGVIRINDFELNIIYDPPHLIKGLRNNFLNKNIKYEGRIAKWDDIVDVYKSDSKHAEPRMQHKLNDEHIIPEKIRKMKVKNCTRVFSKTMAAALLYTADFGYYRDGRPVSATLNNTAEVISFLDDLFDSVNGASLHNIRKTGKPLRTAVQRNSVHHRFWREAIHLLENMKYVNKKGVEKSVPSKKNFIITLKSFTRLWQFFNNNGVKIVRPRYFNSDPIENLFGQVRAYNYRNNDPDCNMFIVRPADQLESEPSKYYMVCALLLLICNTKLMLDSDYCTIYACRIAFARYIIAPRGGGGVPEARDRPSVRACISRPLGHVRTASGLNYVCFL